MPQDGSDARIAERERTLLLEQLWVNVATLDMPCPFTDDQGLATLWDDAMSHQGQDHLDARSAIERGDRQFPQKLDLRLAIRECEVRDGLLRYRDRLWLPSYEPLTTHVIQKIHDSFLGGHPGRDATIDLVSRQFYWPSINQDIRRFLRNCDVCGRTTIWRDKKKGLLKPLPIPQRIWQEILMDFITDLPPR